MFLNKLQTVAAVLAAVVLLTGVGVFTLHALADKPGDAVKAADDKPKDGDKPKEGPKEGDKPKEGPKDGERPKDGPRDRGRGIRGFVKEVHSQQKLLTVVTAKEDGGGGGVDETVDAATAKIIISGQPASLTELQPGMAVFVPLGADKKAAGVIEASWPVTWGWLKSVDPAANSLTLLTTDKKVEMTFILATDARVVVNGIPARLDDLESRAKVSVEPTRDRKAAVAVTAQGIKGLLQGVVTEVDSGKGTLTLRIGEQGGELALDVARDASVLLDGKAAKLADLTAGALVLVKVGPDKRSAAAIRAAAPR